MTKLECTSVKIKDVLFEVKPEGDGFEITDLVFGGIRLFATVGLWVSGFIMRP